MNVRDLRKVWVCIRAGNGRIRRPRVRSLSLTTLSLSLYLLSVFSLAEGVAVMLYFFALPTCRRHKLYYTHVLVA